MRKISFIVFLLCVAISSSAIAEDEPMIRLKTGLSEEEWLGLHKSFVELRSQVVLIENKRFPKALWYLRIPEQIATDKDAKTGPYQVGMNWRKCANGWKFNDCPIVGLKGVVKGAISCKDAESVDFSLTVKNQSKTVWKRALAWLCFNHSHATDYYRYRNFVCRDSKIVSTPPKAMEHYCIKGHKREWWTMGEITPTKSLIGTECVSKNGDTFCVAIAADKAIMVGQNPAWPCTDIGLFFGDCGPGESATAKGKIYFRSGPPAEILKLYKRDF